MRWFASYAALQMCWLVHARCSVSDALQFAHVSALFGVRTCSSEKSHPAMRLCPCSLSHRTGQCMLVYAWDCGLLEAVAV